MNDREYDIRMLEIEEKIDEMIRKFLEDKQGTRAPREEEVEE
jgi:hypothetical protein